MSFPIIIGTRGSELALWQANFTKNELAKHGIQAELKIIKTKGDATQQWNLSFDKIEGKGFFTKELEDALLANEIDLAVHSCKDLPTTFPDGLTIAAYSKRANPYDILLIKKESVDTTQLLKLKQNAIVGTSSARRKAQLKALLPTITINDLRGNVPTRIKKLKEQDYDAIVLAAAGVERLNIDLSEFELVTLAAPMFIPAPAQGVLAFQIRNNDERLLEICTLLNDKESTALTTVERKILNAFEGGCQMPLGVFAEKIKQEIHIWVSQATSFDTIPKRLHTVVNEVQNAEQLENTTAQILGKLKEENPISVFISSELPKDDYFLKVLEAHKYKVNYQSFMEFSSISFEYADDADWLFFSSKNGVKYFFDCINTLSTKTKIAAINSGTAQAIMQLGFKVDFIGKGNNLQEIATIFDKIANGKMVFIQAKVSMQSIQKVMVENSNTHSLIVYENKPKQDVAAREEEILVFTSPMNVEAYFSKNTLKENQKVISIGNTTTAKLKELNILQVQTAFEPTKWSLLDEVFELS